MLDGIKFGWRADRSDADDRGGINFAEGANRPSTSDSTTDIGLQIKDGRRVPG